VRTPLPLGLAGCALLALSPALPGQLITVHEPGLAWQGLHLDVNRIEKASPAANPSARVIDMNGQVVNTFRDPFPGWAVG
jgi:hypothetical protein